MHLRAFPSYYVKCNLIIVAFGASISQPVVNLSNHWNLFHCKYQNLIKKFILLHCFFLQTIAPSPSKIHFRYHLQRYRHSRKMCISYPRKSLSGKSSFHNFETKLNSFSLFTVVRISNLLLIHKWILQIFSFYFIFFAASCKIIIYLISFRHNLLIIQKLPFESLYFIKIRKI